MGIVLVPIILIIRVDVFDVLAKTTMQNLELPVSKLVLVVAIMVWLKFLWMAHRKTDFNLIYLVVRWKQIKLIRCQKHPRVGERIWQGAKFSYLPCFTLFVYKIIQILYINHAFLIQILIFQVFTLLLRYNFYVLIGENGSYE